jgi:peptide/nickel transport system substrate-binding protein
MRTLVRSLLLATCLTASVAFSAQAQRLTVAQGFDPQTLWPNGTTNAETYNGGTPVVESLMWLDGRDMKVKPLLATSFTMETPTVVLVKLRPNVRFTNGEPMNADAVIFNFNLLVDPKETPAYTRYFETFTKIEKVDDLTVRMTSSVPIPPMDLTLSLFHVVPPNYWKQVGQAEFGKKPIGTGPFIFDRWVRDAELVFKRNPNYWGEASTGFNELVLKPVPDEMARAAGLMTGEYDIVKNLPATAIADVKRRQNVRVVSVPSHAICGMRMSSWEGHTSPLQNKAVRQALNYAVDKKSIIDNILFGNGVPLNGQLLRQVQLGYNPDIKDFPYDPARAKKMLTEAGYPNGFEIGFKIPSGSYANAKEVSEAVAGMLSEVGVRTKIQVVESGEFLRQLRARELWPMSMSCSSPPDDPHFQMSQYHSTWRYAYNLIPELDKLIDEGQQEMDVKKRVEIYQRASQIAYDEAVMIFLYGGVDHFGASAKVKNFAPRGDGRWFYYGISLER